MSLTSTLMEGCARLRMIQVNHSTLDDIEYEETPEFIFCVCGRECSQINYTRFITAFEEKQELISLHGPGYFLNSLLIFSVGQKVLFFFWNTRLQYRVCCCSPLLHTAAPTNPFLTLTSYSFYVRFIFIAFSPASPKWPLSSKLCD
jgi:hypothetical protein